ncbi:MAG: GlxA family transcriptional regulator [Solimonas sp.]
MAKTTSSRQAAAPAAPIEIGVLVYPQAQLAAVYGLGDLFAVATRLAGEKHGRHAPALRVSHWRLAARGRRVQRAYDTHAGLPGEPAVLIVPPRLGEAPDARCSGRLAAWLRERHAAGAVLASVCAGAFLLAESGLLDGRTVTTHWACTDDLAARYPQLRVDGQPLIIDDGDIITAGGLMAWTDLGLRIVDRWLGPAVMAETARFLLVDPPGREQRYYSTFSPRLTHGDGAILKVQHWLQSRGAREISVTAMAAQAHLETRTFQRRFQRATGLRPLEYCQHLRVGKAREMLESGRQAVEQIAWRVGYEDASAFRRIFQKVMGLSPGEYRHRFGQCARAPRHA